MSNRVDSLKQAFVEQGYSLSTIEEILTIIQRESWVPANKDYALQDVTTRRLELLSETTMDYDLPADRVRHFERLTYTGQWTLR